MGLCFHYSGVIADLKRVPELVEEVAEICETLQWKYHLFDNDEATGISFAPPKCEPVFLTFLSTGLLCLPPLLNMNIDGYSTISVKTQYAGMEVHMAVLKLLKYLSSRYFKTFEVNDEGLYWDDFDEEILRGRFAAYTRLAELVAGELQSLTPGNNDDPNQLLGRLERLLKKRFGNAGEGFADNLE